MTRTKHLLQPDRLRLIERPFAWLPCRLLTQRILDNMSPEAAQLYLLLVLASDRQGLSFFGERRICDTLGLTSSKLQLARSQLQALDLVAFDGKTYQLLSLPHHKSPSIKIAASQSHRQLRNQKEDQSQQPCKMPDHVRQILKDIFNS